MQTNIKIVDTTIHENLGVEIDREIGRGKYGIVSVSYTHLTLPTILLV